MGDTVEPNTEAARFFEGADIVEGFHPNILKEVPGVLFVGDEASKIIEKCLFQGSDKFRKGPTLAKASPDNEQLAA